MPHNEIIYFRYPYRPLYEGQLTNTTTTTTATSAAAAATANTFVLAKRVKEWALLFVRRNCLLGYMQHATPINNKKHESWP